MSNSRGFGDKWWFEYKTYWIFFTSSPFIFSIKLDDIIYDKLEKLTSLCYPQYKADPVNFPLTPGTFGYPKTRMKPPLMKLRLGDLYGSDDKEVTGFIKSLSYSYPDQSPWEIRRGQRVPKHITAAITYQVIHGQVPGIVVTPIGTLAAFGAPTTETKSQTFYGINQN